MPDFGDTLAIEAAKEIAKVLAAGLLDTVKKIPALWRRAGSRKQELIEAEVQRSAAALREAGGGLPTTLVQQEGVWEGRLRDLLAEHPDAAAELRDLLDDLRRDEARIPQGVLNVIAAASGAIAQGAMFGNVINYALPQVPGLTLAAPTETANDAQADQP